MGQRSVTDKSLQQLIDHFTRHRLRNEDFEFPDILGAAYEYLIAEFADSAGKKGGEFYTPRAVVRMMIRLVDPEKGMRVYDPCCGSGGMLIYSQEYVEEHGGSRGDLSLFGQEFNGGTWAIAKMNMVLHGINNADLQNDDTLATPKHEESSGELTRFERAITNPPFSQNYHEEGMQHKYRFAFGKAPETGKKADLMFAQHVLAVLEDDGLGAIVMPHGVLFRGGKERDIRRKIIEADRLDAVIGLAPNLFVNTGIPPASWCCTAPARAAPTAEARSCSSTPTANSLRAARRTSWTRSTSRRSSPPTRTTWTKMAWPASFPWRNWPRTISTSTSAATSTTLLRPNRKTSARICTVGCRRRKSAPMRISSPRTALTWPSFSIPPNVPGTSLSPNPAGNP
jgi:hypothetical protein